MNVLHDINDKSDNVSCSPQLCVTNILSLPNKKEVAIGHEGLWMIPMIIIGMQDVSKFSVSVHPKLHSIRKLLSYK